MHTYVCVSMCTCVRASLHLGARLCCRWVRFWDWHQGESCQDGRANLRTGHSLSHLSESALCLHLPWPLTCSSKDVDSCSERRSSGCQELGVDEGGGREQLCSKRL